MQRQLRSPSVRAGLWAAGIVGLVLILAGGIYWRARHLFAPQRVENIARLTEITGVSFPAEATLLDGYSWKEDPDFVIARLGLPKRSLAGFLARNQLKTSARTVENPIDLYADGCRQEMDEMSLVARWHLEHLSRWQQTESELRPKINGEKRIVGDVQMIIDVTDPQTVWLYLRWDARGGFAC